MVDYSKRDAFEAKTHQLFDEYQAANWSSDVAVIAVVFKAMYSSALPASRIEKIAYAMNLGGPTKPEAFANVLKTLCRAKVLRSRAGKERLYEVNF